MTVSPTARLDYYRTARDGVNQLYCVQVATTAAPTAARCRCPGYQDLWAPTVASSALWLTARRQEGGCPIGQNDSSSTQVVRCAWAGGHEIPTWCGQPGPVIGQPCSCLTACRHDVTLAHETLPPRWAEVAWDFMAANPTRPQSTTFTTALVVAGLVSVLPPTPSPTRLHYTALQLEAHGSKTALAMTAPPLPGGDHERGWRDVGFDPPRQGCAAGRQRGGPAGI